MRVLYSFNKKGHEAERWTIEIAAASTDEVTFIPFNHGAIADPRQYTDAIKLDALYRARDRSLLTLYAAVRRMVRDERIDVLWVANAPPYHPDFLRELDVYKVLYSADDPEATYMINIPYLHAYQHVFFVDPVYSADMDMTEKMRYAGMTNADWLPISVFDFEHDPSRSETEVFASTRDVDLVYVGSFWRQKIDTLVKVRKAFGSRCRVYGFFRVKHNAYLNVVHQAGMWVRPLSHEARVQIYQRAKIGFNIHWNEYGLGNQRLYHLPANGVMQISDCADHLGRVFALGTEIESYRNPDELIEKIRHYLQDDQARLAIARAGYRRVMREYRFRDVTRRGAELIRRGMTRIAWRRTTVAAGSGG